MTYRCVMCTAVQDVAMIDVTPLGAGTPRLIPGMHAPCRHCGSARRPIVWHSGPIYRPPILVWREPPVPAAVIHGLKVIDLYAATVAEVWAGPPATVDVPTPEDLLEAAGLPVPWMVPPPST